MCVWVYVWERERVCVCVRERERVCACVCVWQDWEKAQCWRQWDSCMIMWWLALFAWVLLWIWWCWPGGGAGCSIDSVVLLTSAIAELWPQATRFVHNPPASHVGLDHLGLKGQGPSVFLKTLQQGIADAEITVLRDQRNQRSSQIKQCCILFKGKRGCYTWITDRQINIIIPV